MSAPKGIEAASIYREFFALHLAFADALAAASNTPLADVVTWRTNMHRLFGYGHLGKMAPAPAFCALVEDVASMPGREAQIDRLVAAFAQRPFTWPFVAEDAPADRNMFGCFACEAPTAEGVVRLHFGNRDTANGVGPLHASKRAARRAELKALTAHIAATWPEANSILGGSWLYNTEAYRRLFPREFADSRTVWAGPRSTNGMSSWGQLLDHLGHVKRDLANRFLANLAAIDPQQPWLVFPLPLLTTTAPISAFRREYGV